MARIIALSSLHGGLIDVETGSWYNGQWAEEFAPRRNSLPFNGGSVIRSNGGLLCIALVAAVCLGPLAGVVKGLERDRDPLVITGLDIPDLVGSYLLQTDLPEEFRNTEPPGSLLEWRCRNGGELLLDLLLQLRAKPLELLLRREFW